MKYINQLNVLLVVVGVVVMAQTLSTTLWRPAADPHRYTVEVPAVTPKIVPAPRVASPSASVKRSSPASLPPSNPQVLEPRQKDLAGEHDQRAPSTPVFKERGTVPGSPGNASVVTIPSGSTPTGPEGGNRVLWQNEPGSGLRSGTRSPSQGPFRSGAYPPFANGAEKRQPGEGSPPPPPSRSSMPDRRF